MCSILPTVFRAVPEDVLGHALTFIEPRERLTSVERVSRSWLQATRSELVWAPHLEPPRVGASAGASESFADLEPCRTLNWRQQYVTRERAALPLRLASIPLPGNFFLQIAGTGAIEVTDDGRYQQWRSFSVSVAVLRRSTSIRLESDDKATSLHFDNHHDNTSMVLKAFRGDLTLLSFTRTTHTPDTIPPAPHSVATQLAETADGDATGCVFRLQSDNHQWAVILDQGRPKHVFWRSAKLPDIEPDKLLRDGCWGVQ